MAAAMAMATDSNKIRESFLLEGLLLEEGLLEEDGPFFVRNGSFTTERDLIYGHALGHVAGPWAQAGRSGCV